ncbi:hypothetical protein Cadr_000021949 [Camelus dromedarius]|uniref:Uncharacterized protein n=1 Tax=Camelus dromedarius TaxID=9838 RepID=A0A5N4CSK0_CAMDR|nr:hypothetical protein Cadr_000021949 [Camelus dromedarius]
MFDEFVLLTGHLKKTPSKQMGLGLKFEWKREAHQVCSASKSRKRQGRTRTQNSALCSSHTHIFRALELEKFPLSALWYSHQHLA